MYSQMTLLFFYVETPLHAGSGISLGAVDLPVQRERYTNLPMLQASGVKGVLRDWAEMRAATQDAKDKVILVFGPEGDNASDHAGALGPGDARLLLLPIRSLKGVFAWCTSPHALHRLKRDLKQAGNTTSDAGQPHGWEVPTPGDEQTAMVNDPCGLSIGGEKLVLEEFAFNANPHDDNLNKLAAWLQQYALPQDAEYVAWKTRLSNHLVVLHDDVFRDFAQTSLEVLTRVKLGKNKTVEAGPFNEEHLPSDTLLYSPLFISEPRVDSGPKRKTLDDAGKVLEWLKELNFDRLQMGGDETVGRGIVKVYFERRHADGTDTVAG